MNIRILKTIVALVLCVSAAYGQQDLPTNLNVKANLPIATGDTLTTWADTLTKQFKHIGNPTWIADIDEHWYWNGLQWKRFSGVGGGGASSASDVTIADAGGYYNGSNVEAALQEIAGGSGGENSEIMSSHLINLRTGATERVDNLTDKQRGQALQDFSDSAGDSTAIWMPPFTYLMPFSTGGFSPGRRQDFIGFSNRATEIAGDSTHAVRFQAGQSTYRITFTNISFVTYEASPTDTLDGVHFEDQENPGGVITFNHCHWSQADRDALHIGKNWIQITVKQGSFSGSGGTTGIGRYGFYSNGGQVVADILTMDQYMLLDTFSTNNRITYTVAQDFFYKEHYEDYGTDNTIVSMKNLQTHQKRIGGNFDLMNTSLRDIEKIVFYSPMDGYSFDGTVLKDFSSSGAYGMSFGDNRPVLFEDKEFGECLSFDGVDDYVEVFFQDELKSQDMTISMLVKVDSINNSRILSGMGLDFSIKDPLEFRIFLESGFTTTSPRIDTNQWYLFSISFDHTTGDHLFYINGQEVNTHNVASSIDTTLSGQLLIGSRTIDSNPFMGKIKDLMIYDGYYEGIHADLFNAFGRNEKPITGQSIRQERLNLNTGSVLYYNPMNSLQLSPKDFGINNLDGTLSGSPVLAESVFGSTGIVFDNTDDQIVVSSGNAFDVQEIFVSAVVNATTLTNRRVFYLPGSIDLFVKNDGLFARLYYDSGSSILLEYDDYDADREGSTFHIGVARKDSIGYLLVNGAIVDQQNIGSSLTWDYSTGDLAIGNLTGGSSWWHGLIDEVLVLDEFSKGLAKLVYSKIVSGSPILPFPLVPDDQTASQVDITDAGGYYTGTTVEAALQEIAGGGGGSNTLENVQNTEGGFSVFQETGSTTTTDYYADILNGDRVELANSGSTSDTVAYPVGFTYNPSWLQIYRVGQNEFATNVDSKEAFRDTFMIHGKTYYVDPVNGSNFNDGLTKGSAYETYIFAEGRGDGVVFYLKGGVHPYDFPANSNNASLIAYGGTPIVGDIETPQTWESTVTPGVYKATYSTSFDWIINPSIRSSEVTNECVHYVAVSDTLDLKDGTYYSSGSELYVKTHGGDKPDHYKNLAIIKGPTTLVNSDSVYTEGVEFYGGLSLSGAARNFFINRGGVFYSQLSPALDLISIDGSNTILNNIRFGHSAADAIDHRDNSTAIELNCIGRFAGYDVSGAANQLSTLHLGADVIRINCDYQKASNQAILDVNSGSQAWVLGGKYGTPWNKEGSFSAIGAGQGSGNFADMWLDGVRFVGNNDVDLLAIYSTIYARNIKLNSRTKTNFTNNGTIKKY